MARIRTNNVPRLIIDSYELSEAERKEFDYLDWEAIERGEDSATFFRYRGQLYDLSQFTATTRTPEFSPMRKWDGYFSDSAFSAIVVRFTVGGVLQDDYVVVGLYLE